MTNSKESSHSSQYDATIFLYHCNASPPSLPAFVPNITVVRRNNVVTLFQQFAEEQMRFGVAPKGLEQAFAQKLQVSPSMWSQIKSSRPIGDKLARQVEAACERDVGWLDVERAGQGLTAGEQQFLGLALKAWRGVNAETRKKLKEQLKEMIREG